jgi:predicted RNA binding protein YcfA (HicA-like mRNA interferase family)
MFCRQPTPTLVLFPSPVAAGHLLDIIEPEDFPIDKLKTLEDVAEWLVENGFKLDRTKGSHRQYRHPAGMTVTVTLEVNRNFGHKLENYLHRYRHAIRELKARIAELRAR